MTVIEQRQIQFAYPSGVSRQKSGNFFRRSLLQRLL